MKVKEIIEYLKYVDDYTDLIVISRKDYEELLEYQKRLSLVNIAMTKPIDLVSEYANKMKHK